jgi:rhamnogalacturonan acetylesterase
MQSKGATVIISSSTPDNPCEGGTCTAAAGRFQTYAHDSAAATGSAYVDHFAYVVQMDKALGVAATDAFYPNDHTHTSPAGADKYAQAFVKGLSCGSSSLKSYINSAGNSVNGKIAFPKNEP